MKLDQAIQERRSIRGFTDKPVPQDLLEEIIALANRSFLPCAVFILFVQLISQKALENFFGRQLITTFNTKFLLQKLSFFLV